MNITSNTHLLKKHHNPHQNHLKKSVTDCFQFICWAGFAFVSLFLLSLDVTDTSLSSSVNVESLISLPTMSLVAHVNPIFCMLVSLFSEIKINC